MKVLLFYQDRGYVEILHLNPGEEDLIRENEDVDNYLPMTQILEKRGLDYDNFSPIWSIDESDEGFPVFEDGEECPVHIIR